MNFPIFVEAVNGQFAASLVGAPGVRVVGPNRTQVLTSLKAEIQRRVALGELVSLEIESVSVSSLAGKYGSDPTLRQISDEAYRLRDADRVQ